MADDLFSLDKSEKAVYDKQKDKGCEKEEYVKVPPQRGRFIGWKVVRRAVTEGKLLNRNAEIRSVSIPGSSPLADF